MTRYVLLCHVMAYRISLWRVMSCSAMLWQIFSHYYALCRSVPCYAVLYIAMMRYVVNCHSMLGRNDYTALWCLFSRDDYWQFALWPVWRWRGASCCEVTVLRRRPQSVVSYDNAECRMSDVTVIQWSHRVTVIQWSHRVKVIQWSHRVKVIQWSHRVKVIQWSHRVKALSCNKAGCRILMPARLHCHAVSRCLMTVIVEWKAPAEK